ncbi:hypothetical protein EVAR_18445_1 [Eumeta japonica]|uniref:Uncharacterized protein n=1 Tax=Eumeta variegata TaxID=151549 RepID=A0A4C1V0X0_EUMVA|nr:hypothetical protein EVAR_18445_1 [Eumeta japonica]
MRSLLFLIGLVGVLAVCGASPAKDDVVEKIPPKAGQTPSAIGSAGAGSTAAAGGAGASKAAPAGPRARRDVGQESDLLPSANDVEASAFGETSQLAGRGRIRVLPAYLG